MSKESIFTIVIVAVIAFLVGAGSRRTEQPQPIAQGTIKHYQYHRGTTTIEGSASANDSPSHGYYYPEALLIVTDDQTTVIPAAQLDEVVLTK